MDTVEIPREEYERLKRPAREDTPEECIDRSLEDLKAGHGGRLAQRRPHI